MTVAEAVRAARRMAGLSQRDLAVRARVPQSTIARIELETIEPRSSTAEKILAAAGYDISIEPRPGEGVDRSLIREFLKLTPRERVDSVAASGELGQRLYEAMQHR